MSRNRIFPQLAWPIASSIAAEYQHLQAVELHHQLERIGIDLEGVFYSAVGGNRVEAREIDKFRDKLCATVSPLGFPNQASTRETRRHFDIQVSGFLHKEMGISPNQASLPAVWQSMTCLIAPDLVLWRFSGSGDDGASLARFRGGVRNTFERLWWRGEVLGRETEEPYELIARLNEDELVQIMERPNLRANRRLARVIGAEFLLRQNSADVPREALMRDVQKRVYRLLPFISFESLDDAMLGGLVADVFSEAIAALQISDDAP
jgi:hypothetical protein